MKDDKLIIINTGEIDSQLLALIESWRLALAKNIALKILRFRCADDWDNQFATLGGYIEFTRAWLKECRRVLSPNGSIWVIGGMQCIYTIGNALQELGYWIINV